MSEAKQTTEESFTADIGAGDYQSFGQETAGEGVEAAEVKPAEGEEAAYEIADGEGQEGDAVEIIEDDAAAENGEGEKPAAAVLTGDAEADEHDSISMPVMKLVQSDLAVLNREKRLIVRTLTVAELGHPVLQQLINSEICQEVSIQYVSSSQPDQDMAGIMNIAFKTTKHATEAIPMIQQIRDDLDVQKVPENTTPNHMIEKWKREHAAENQWMGAMLIVKNLDPATATVEKLAELFPGAEDVAISCQPQASNLGKLKGKKHAYVLYKDEETANATFEAVAETPLELDGHKLIVRQYKEPPNHIPEGYLKLTTRKLVLRQTARAKGLIVRAEEDPTFEVSNHWPERLKLANELIEKDDAARDILGLPKPTLVEFKDMTNLRQLPARQVEVILNTLKLADNPPGFLGAGKKRPGMGDSEQARKVGRGGGPPNKSRAPPLLGRGIRPARGFGNPGMGGPTQLGSMLYGLNRLLGRGSPRGMPYPGGMQYGLTPGPGNYPMRGGGMMRGRGRRW